MTSWSYKGHPSALVAAHWSPVTPVQTFVLWSVAIFCIPLNQDVCLGIDSL